jgi:anti-sigma regulatory factor (Ser/Thr protein kinase)
MEQVFKIQAGNFVQAGEASGNVKKLLKQLGIDSTIVRRIAIASYEAEMNIVIHSYGGTLKIEISPHDVLLVAEDTGPGIADIELAMQEGYSTAPEAARELGFGAGMGLANIKRCADRFDIVSSAGQNTRLSIYFGIKAR